MKKIIRFPQKILVWADGFEISKVINSLQGKCPTAPFCNEGIELSIYECARIDCPYEFDFVKDCIEYRNQAALELALFNYSEAKLLKKFLNSLGYISIVEEDIDVTQKPHHILMAHGILDENYERELLKTPVGPVIMVRHNRPKKTDQFRILE